jgi:hypothetical protein
MKKSNPLIPQGFRKKAYEQMAYNGGYLTYQECEPLLNEIERLQEMLSISNDEIRSIGQEVIDAGKDEC